MFCSEDRHILIFPIDKNETVNLVAFHTDRSLFPQRPSLKASEPWIQASTKEEMISNFPGWGTDMINMMNVSVLACFVKDPVLKQDLRIISAWKNLRSGLCIRLSLRSTATAMATYVLPATQRESRSGNQVISVLTILIVRKQQTRRCATS
jgi:hypothetical protein